MDKFLNKRIGRELVIKEVGKDIERIILKEYKIGSKCILLIGDNSIEKKILHNIKAEHIQIINNDIIFLQSNRSHNKIIIN